jgi:2-dehydropantoate 2-reductase
MRTADTVETDYLNGEIAALAAELGLDAPINTALAALAREAVEKHWKPGVFTSAELAQLLSRVG